MKVTLRKAAKIRSKIENKLRDIYVQISYPVVDINVYDPDPVEQFREAKRDFYRKYIEYTTLLNALVELRTLIANANANVGINTDLTKLAGLNARLSLVKKYKNENNGLTEDQLKARVNGLRERLSLSEYATHEVIRVSFFDFDTQQEFVSEEYSLQNEVEHIVEEIERKNNTHYVVLNDDLVSVLNNFNLL